MSHLQFITSLQNLDELLESRKQLDDFTEEIHMQAWRHLTKLLFCHAKLQLTDPQHMKGVLQKYIGPNGIANPYVRTLMEGMRDGTQRVCATANTEQWMIQGPPHKCALGVELPQTVPHTLCLPDKGKALLTKWHPYTSMRSLRIGPESDITHWKDIPELQAPCDTIIIADNYLLAFPQYNNLFDILRTIIGEKKHSSWQFMILVSKLHYKDYVPGMSNPQEIPLRDAYKNIYEFLSRELKLPHFDFCIVKCHSSANHDRHIFTNHFVFKSGNSFSYFDAATGKVRLNLTDLQIFPYAAYNRQEPYISYYQTHLRTIRKVVENAEDFCGGKHNRLLGI